MKRFLAHMARPLYIPLYIICAFLLGTLGGLLEYAGITPRLPWWLSWWLGLLIFASLYNLHTAAWFLYFSFRDRRAWQRYQAGEAQK